MMCKVRIILVLLFVALELAVLRTAARGSSAPPPPPNLVALQAARARAEVARLEARVRANRAREVQLEAATAAHSRQLNAFEVQRRLGSELHHIERSFQLPEGTLNPASAYLPSQRDSVIRHLQDPDSKMFTTHYVRPGGYLVYASPILVPSPELGFTQRVLLVFKLYTQRHQVVPLGYTQVRPGTPQGHMANFMDRAITFAQMNWAQLHRDYGPLEIIDPPNLHL